jgi:hypothetical protein
VSWAVEGALAAHTSPTPLGELSVTWVSGSAGIDVTLREAFSLAVGPRLSLAHVAANGENRFGVHSLTQTANLPLLGARASLGAALGGAWQIAAAIEAERALRGLVLTAGGDRNLWLAGWIAAFGVGVRCAF